jgi:hypothetical protein
MLSIIGYTSLTVYMIAAAIQFPPVYRLMIALDLWLTERHRFFNP